jgi:hypothetical protein
MRSTDATPGWASRFAEGGDVETEEVALDALD